MKNNNKSSVLLISMPFVLLNPPSTQLAALEAYLNSKSHPVASKHLYIKCCDLIGIAAYNWMTVAPPEVKEAIYARLLYPDYYAEHQREIKEIFKNAYDALDDVLGHSNAIDTIHEKMNAFNAYCLDKIEWGNFDYVGFTINIGQLFASVYLAKEIKARYPNITVIFGGYSASEERGAGILNSFPYVDYIISGEGEQSLYELVNITEKKQIRGIEGLIYRSGERIAFNTNKSRLDIESLPFYTFDSYFKDLDDCSEETKLFCETNFDIPIESTRGCWWSKCNFCNCSNRPDPYRAKSTEKIISEIKYQSDKYKSLSFYFLDESIRPKDVGGLFASIRKTGKDFIISSLGRTLRLPKSDYLEMRNAGVVRYQVGAEAFSTSLLEKMNKGITAIENIQVLRRLMEMRIIPVYTLMYDFPYQDKKDYDETVRTLSFLRGFPPPVGLFKFELQPGSLMFHHYQDYNISDMNPDYRTIRYCPPNIAGNLVPLSFEFQISSQDNLYHKELQTLLESFKTESEAYWTKIKGKPSLFYNDGIEYLVIHDIRDEHKKKFILDSTERSIYLYCDEIRLDEDIFKKFSDISEYQIRDILDLFIDHKLLYSERNEYLSLAVKHNLSVEMIT